MRKLNWKKTVAVSAALALCAGVLAGCGAASSTAASGTAAGSAAASEVDSEEADEMAAKKVADLIDAIYVQERNENTDAQCEAAGPHCRSSFNLMYNQRGSIQRIIAKKKYLLHLPPPRP